MVGEVSHGNLPQGPAPASLPAWQTGCQAEDRALDYLLAQGLRLVRRNYQTGAGRSRPGGEIDLIMQSPDGTLVFVEVRARSNERFGGAEGSVQRGKRRRLIRAAQHYLLRLAVLPPCRFDVVAFTGSTLSWLPAAFDAEAG